MKRIIALDIGSSSIKACLFELTDEIKLLYYHTESIGLYSPKADYAQNDPKELWDGVCEAILNIFTNTDVKKEDIGLISICSQAQCVILVDKEGKALTPIINSQDGRATDSFYKYYVKGPVKVDGLNLFKLAGCLLSSGFAPGAAKDPVFKFKWVEDNMPEIYDKAYKWLDVKDYILLCLTGEFVTTKDNAHAYTIYNSKENKGNWSKTVTDIFKVDRDKLPKVIASTDIAGYLNEEAAKKSGLCEGIPVIGGIIDSTGVQYGSGAADVGEAMIYWGTSGWVGTVVDKLIVNLFARIGALIGAEDDKFHYFAMMDSAGISYEWIRNHIIKADGFLGTKEAFVEDEDRIYDLMDKALLKVNPGSDGLMFAPWITGMRAPVEASDIGGMFINVKNYMDKKYFIRATVEGICYQYRLLLELGIKQTGKVGTLRFVGGGAESDEIAQILSDITGLLVEVPKNPRDAGALGAAIVGFKAMDDSGISLSQMAHRQKANKTFLPNPQNQKLYDKYYLVFKKLYKQNKKILKDLTKISKGK